MRPAHRAATFMALTAVAALTLTGCADGTAGDGGSSNGPAAQTAEARPPASIIPVATSSPAPAGAVTFTFADGRLSFAHPEGWRVEHEQVSSSPAVETATVYDAGGNEQVAIYYSQVGDATAGHLSRFVLETDPVPGLIGAAVPTPSSSFFVDHAFGTATYRMGLTAGLPVSPDGQVQYGLIMLGDRILTADVLFTSPPFTGDEAAKAWYWGAEGQALKSVLMSFSYR
jgi:Ca2+-binding RTX toxin-like protein